MGVIVTGMTLVGVSGLYQQIIQGLVVIVAVASRRLEVTPTNESGDVNDRHADSN
jgi:predicted ABC-type sugar transport system permease subunit